MNLPIVGGGREHAAWKMTQRSSVDRVFLCGARQWGRSMPATAFNTHTTIKRLLEAGAQGRGGGRGAACARRTLRSQKRSHA